MTAGSYGIFLFEYLPSLGVWVYWPAALGLVGTIAYAAIRFEDKHRHNEQFDDRQFDGYAQAFEVYKQSVGGEKQDVES